MHCNPKTAPASPPSGVYHMQEFVARVHALGVVRKRIMPFRLGQARGASCLSSGGCPAMW